jgi:nicotinamidase-related amidase
MLVVIDMQSDFDASSDPQTISEVVKLIKQAKLLKQRILIVEYWGYSPTIPEVMDAVDGYDLVDVIQKAWDDGSDEIAAYANKLADTDPTFDPTEEPYTFCGVNWGACVRRTVVGMAQYTDNLHVVEAACNQPEAWHDYTDPSHWDDQRELMQMYANVI